MKKVLIGEFQSIKAYREAKFEVRARLVRNLIEGLITIGIIVFMGWGWLYMIGWLAD